MQFSQYETSDFQNLPGFPHTPSSALFFNCKFTSDWDPWRMLSKLFLCYMGQMAKSIIKILTSKCTDSNFFL